MAMKGNQSWKQLGQSTGAFALGATAGSVIALLFAPASGKVTRRRIGMKFRTLQHSTVRSLKQAKKLILKKAENLREVATKKIGNLRESLVTNGNGKRSLQRRVVHHA